jgi:hypothetical protein
MTMKTNNNHHLAKALGEQRLAFGVRPQGTTEKAKAITAAYLRGASETAILCGCVREDQRSIVQMLAMAGRYLEALEFIENAVRSHGEKS